MMKASQPALSLFLDRLLRRSSLSADEIASVLNLPGETKSVSANIDFVEEGQLVDHACLVVKGVVGRFNQLGDGRREITAFHIPGDMPDLLAVPLPRIAFGLTAICASEIVRVSHRDLLGIAAKHPGIALAFLRDAAADASILSAWVTNIGRRTATERVAHLLCELDVRFRDIGQWVNHGFTLPCTQMHLADATGLTSVHMNRVLQQLKRQGLVRFSAGSVEIHDWRQLRALANFNMGYLHSAASAVEQDRDQTSIAYITASAAPLRPDGAAIVARRSGEGA